ncbi:MAG: hypothetical protein ACO3LT_07160 [Ilumatobacteraceae bacterium]
MKKLPDLALTTGEAAAVLGVHFTRVKKMADAGQIRSKVIYGGWGKSSARMPAIYSLADCQENFAEYLELRKDGDPSIRRPRTRIDEREPMLKALQKVPQILFDDACGTGDAATSLRIDPKLCIRYAEGGALVARKGIDTDRVASGDAKWWIYSRASIEDRRAAVMEAERRGRKTGRYKFYERE